MFFFFFVHSFLKCIISMFAAKLDWQLSHYYPRGHFNIVPFSKGQSKDNHKRRWPPLPSSTQPVSFKRLHQLHRTLPHLSRRVIPQPFGPHFPKPFGPHVVNFFRAVPILYLSSAFSEREKQGQASQLLVTVVANRRIQQWSGDPASGVLGPDR